MQNLMIVTVAAIICSTMVVGLKSCSEAIVDIRQVEAQREAACLDRGGSISPWNGHCEGARK